MSKTYKLTYHLAAGEYVAAGGLSKDDIDKLRKFLGDDTGVIYISGRNAVLAHLIPVRSVLFVEIMEEL